jgi:hypothetical protein
MVMRRLIILALFGILAASLPLVAQHGGGHGSAGGHGGFSGHGGFGGGGHAGGGGAFVGGHSGSGLAPRSFAGVSPRAGFSSRGLNSRNFNHFRGSGFRSRGLRNFCSGYRCGYGYGYPWLGGAFDPYWSWDSGSSYDDDQQDQMGLANEMNAQSLYDQRMREQDDPGVYSRPAPAHQPVHQHQEVASEVVPPTVLVFRDQHKQEVQNYAIVGQTLWNFSAQRTEKIPLSNLDLPATTKANDDRGVDFRLPGANEGQ